MNETVISWTAPNFVTIAFMMIISSVVIGAIAKMAMAKRGGGE